MATTLDSFEIRTLTGKQWSTDSRSNDEQEAVRKTNNIAGSSHIGGVKVVQELYDNEESLFRSKTVFSYYKQDEKVLNPELNKDKLCSTLHGGIQSAAGDTPVEGVLFRNINFF